MINEIFIGGREKGLLALQALVEMKAHIVHAYVLKEDEHEYEKFFPEIETFCKKNKIPYTLTKSVKKRVAEVLAMKPDLIIVSGWRTLIPMEIVNYPKFGCATLHESLLPKYRGFAPINWAVINGEKKTGVTLFHLAEEVDSGDIIAQKSIPISNEATAYEIYKKSIIISRDLLKEYHQLLIDGKAPRIKQNERLATFACSRLPEDAKIDFTAKTKAIYNLIRGSSYPYPGAFCFHKDTKVIVQKALIPKQKTWIGSIPGRIISIAENGVEVLTGDGSILITEIEINGERVEPGAYFTSVKERLI